MDSNKVKFGFKNVHIAPIIEEDVDGKLTYDTPIKVPGAVSFSPEQQSSENQFYADNMVYWSGYSDGGYAGDLEMAKIPDEVLVAIFNFIEDDNGALVEVSGQQATPFALMGEIAGDVHESRFVFTKCSSSKPSREVETIGDSTEPKTEKLSITCTPAAIGEKDGEMVYAPKITVNKGDTGYDTFFDSVYTPAFTNSPTV